MSYRIRIRPSGHEFVTGTDESVLDAALRNGHILPYGCRNGTCGACIGKVVEGAITYAGERPPAITDAEAATGQVLLCQGYAQSDCELEITEIDQPKDIVVRTLPVRVVGIEPAAHDVSVLRLKLPAAERLQFMAGQYIDLILRDGRRRSFSLANPPHDDEHLELHVRRIPGGRFSDRLLSDLREKALLRFEGPLGTFYLREDSDKPIVLMAGGTGFAPIKSIVEHALAADLRRPMHLFWGARAGRDLYRDALARGWAAQHDHIDYTPVLSEPAEDDPADIETGFVHEAVLRAYPDLSGHQVYMSGPPPMIDAGRQAFRAAGLPRDELFFDSFDYASDAVEGMVAAGLSPY